MRFSLRRLAAVAGVVVGCASSSATEPTTTNVDLTTATATSEASASNPHRDALLALKEAEVAPTAASSDASSANQKPQPTATAQPSASALAAARELFQKGVEAFGKGDWPAARAAFEASYSLAPTAKVLFNIGQAALKEGNRAIGCDAYQRFVNESKPPIQPQRVIELRRDCPKLK